MKNSSYRTVSFSNNHSLHVSPRREEEISHSGTEEDMVEFHFKSASADRLDGRQQKDRMKIKQEGRKRKGHVLMEHTRLLVATFV